MTNIKSTKRALFSSVIALLLCFTMLLGSTFAWFTDSVTSGNNKIVAGNLDVVLEYKTDWADDWATVDENTKIFDENALYEPGYTEVVYLRISNAGSLALKYNLMVNILSEKTSTNINGDEFKLSDYLQIGTYRQDEYSSGFNYADLLMPVMFGTRESALSNVTLTKLSEANSTVVSDSPLLAGEETAQVMALVLTMPETVGNEANHKSDAEAPEINLGVSLVATQHTDESDSFNNQYDAGATYPVASTEELSNALEVAQDGDTIKLTTGTFELPAEITNGIAIVGSGSGTVISANVPTGGSIDNETAAIEVSAANVTLKNLVIDAADGGNGSLILSTGENLTVENCTFDMRGTNDAGVYLFDSDSAAIRNCTFIDGYKSIYVNGKDSDTDTDTDKLLIENCTFKGTYALHVGGATNVVANNCDFNGVAITLWNSTAIFTDCDFNDGTYNQILNYYSPITFNNCFFGGDFVYALRQAASEVNVVVNNATYETSGNNFTKQCGWSITTNGSITSYDVTEDGNTTAIPTSQKV